MKLTPAQLRDIDPQAVALVNEGRKLETYSQQFIFFVTYEWTQ
jgi:hypothetical protein